MATLSGHVRRITFRNEQSAYTVAKIAVDEPSGREQEVTVVGHFPSIAPGEWLELEGEWYVHKEFGRQFKATAHRKAPPATVQGIERYLASGAVKGIGPALARRLVAKFGERTLEVMEKEPERLLEVEGIGSQRLAAIAAAAKEERAARDILVFLEGYGVTPALAARIVRAYGERTVAVVRENPYCLADDVFGIGFKTADRIAMAMGIDRASPKRAAAALAYLLNQAGVEGHVYLPEEVLVRRAGDLEIPPEAAKAALSHLAGRREVVIEEGAVYPAFLHRAEVEAAERLLRLAAAGEAQDLDLFGGVYAGGEPGHGALDFETDGLSDEQRRAVALATAPGGGVMVLTGGPGTGKTTTLKAIVEQYERAKRPYSLAAPTGRAAKRLQEATGREARTIHRLLEYSGGEEGGPRFLRGENSPLRADAIIVDEASMVDLPLFYYLLRAIRPQAKLILVGDADQLPSVGPGNVLRDVLQSPRIPSVRLTRIFRQAQQSRIVVNAHRIRRGEKPVWGGEGSDFFFLPAESDDEAIRLVVDLAARRLPAYLGCSPLEGVQVLSTVRRGPLGVENLNAVLQEALNPPRPGEPAVHVGKEVFRRGDRVMQVRNDYDRMVFNGDIGIVREVDPGERRLLVDFPDRDEPAPVVYEAQDLHQLTLAYCTSVHKSQGSEYPAVVMPIHWVMPALMHRNLLYTAVTRARRLVVLVGREDALNVYVRSSRAEKRYTRLAQRLR